MKNQQNYRTSGLTLIESLIWLAILASIIVGVFSIYNKTRDNKNISIVSQELSTIFSKTDSIYSTNNTDGLNNLTALNLGLFPKTVKIIDSSTGKLANIFGGEITITGNPPNEFSVTYTKIPRGEICYKIIDSQKKVGWYSLNSVGFFNQSYIAHNIAGYCKETTGNNIIDLTFTKSF